MITTGCPIGRRDPTWNDQKNRKRPKFGETTKNIDLSRNDDNFALADVLGILYMIFDDWLTWTSYLKICLMGESRQLEQNYRCGCRNVMNVLRLFHHNTEWIKVDWNSKQLHSEKIGFLDVKSHMSHLITMARAIFRASWCLGPWSVNCR